MIFWTFGIMALALLAIEIIEGAGRGYEQPRAGALVAAAATGGDMQTPASEQAPPGDPS
jgi:hypothetical protein